VPRFIRIFTPDDLIRLYLNNLDPDDQEVVTDFFKGDREGLALAIAEQAAGVLGTIPFVGFAGELFGLTLDIIQVENLRQLVQARIRTENRLLLPRN